LMPPYQDDSLQSFVNSVNETKLNELKEKVNILILKLRDEDFDVIDRNEVLKIDVEPYKVATEGLIEIIDFWKKAT